MTITLTRYYSEKNGKGKPAYVNEDDDLSKYKTKTGIVGSVIPGVPGIMGAESKRDFRTKNLIGLGVVASGPLGRYAANRKAEELDKEGKDDKEILKRSTLKGTSVGAITGATAGALLGVARRGEISKMAALGATLGSVGSGYGSYSSVKERLDTRKKYADRS